MLHTYFTLNSLAIWQIGKVPERPVEWRKRVLQKQHLFSSHELANVQRFIKHYSKYFPFFSIYTLYCLLITSLTNQQFAKNALYKQYIFQAFYLHLKISNISMFTKSKWNGIENGKKFLTFAICFICFFFCCAFCWYFLATKRSLSYQQIVTQRTSDVWLCTLIVTINN